MVTGREKLVNLSPHAIDIILYNGNHYNFLGVCFNKSNFDRLFFSLHTRVIRRINVELSKYKRNHFHDSVLYNHFK